MTNEKTMELNEMELMDVCGGNWFTDTFDSVCDWCSENADIVTRAACLVGGVALVATGIGAGAGLGLIAVESIGGAAIASTGFGSIIGTVVGAAVTD